jgi:hypothetical protein
LQEVAPDGRGCYRGERRNGGLVALVLSPIGETLAQHRTYLQLLMAVRFYVGNRGRSGLGEGDFLLQR